LNSIDPVNEAALRDWFILDPGDRRQEHQLLVQYGNQWQPVPGTERFPMILVSWYGANSYSLWANGYSWHTCRGEPAAEADGLASFLPSESQWEYAARGSAATKYPWGDEDPTPDRLRAGRHRVRNAYSAATLPMAAVNEQLGMSPFGLHHMAGNVWQWCRDWYDPEFYRSPAALRPNAENRQSTGIRSERGGSWVSPPELARSSYRRGRNPSARGRCLGFRCVGDAIGASPAAEQELVRRLRR
jgi:formylglycine-generating enzyme required for sulfatase activity